MAFRKSRRFNTESKTQTTRPRPRPQTAQTVPAEKPRGTRRRVSLREEGAERGSARRDPNRVVLGPDGRVGRVGSGWWGTRGQSLLRHAQRRDPEDVVLEICKLAASQFTEWDTAPLPPGAQRVYDQISRFVSGDEDAIEEAPAADAVEEAPTAEAAEEVEAEEEKPRSPRRRGRRSRRPRVEETSAAPSDETAEAPEAPVEEKPASPEAEPAPEETEAQGASDGDPSNGDEAVDAQDDASATIEAEESPDDAPAEETSAEAS